MKIEKQVCSEELSKQLDELRAGQDSYWMWVKYALWKESRLWLSDLTSAMKSTCLSGKREYAYSAFTVAELGKMLPISCHTTRFEMGYEYQCHYQLWDVGKEEMKYIHNTASETEADARASMLIYLLKNKLICLSGK